MQRSEPPGSLRRSPIPAFEPQQASLPSPPCDEDLVLVLEEGPADGSRLLACLQAWAHALRTPPARAPTDPGPGHVRQAEHSAGRRAYHYWLRVGPGSDELPEAVQLARAAASLPLPLPPDWVQALVRGWPPRLRGLHRIELVPGRAWISIEIGLKPTLRRRLDQQAANWLSDRRSAAFSNAAPRSTGQAQSFAQAQAHAIVVGAGLAGCAMADALLRRGWRVTVIEAAGRIGGAVAEIPLLAQHPALSPGEDRRSRLLIAALLASRRLADRLGPAMSWCGRFQPMPFREALLRTAGIPDSLAQAIPAARLADHGVEGLQGIWFPGCAIADPAVWWQRLLQACALELHLSRPVVAIARDNDSWHALDERGRPIAAAPVMVLANQAGAFSLAGMPPAATGNLRHSLIQVAIGTAAHEDRDHGAPRILGGSSYRLQTPGRHCVIGPLRPGQDNLARHDIELPGVTIGHPSYRWSLSHPAERLLLRDNLPMIGAAPDIAAITARCKDHERNDRLQLPRRSGLHLLTGLGGRGLLWSVLGAEIIAAAVNQEPDVVEPDLQEAVDPARFLRRALRRKVLPVGTTPTQVPGPTPESVAESVAGSGPGSAPGPSPGSTPAGFPQQR